MFLPSLSRLFLTGADESDDYDDEGAHPPEYDQNNQGAMMQLMNEMADEEWGRRYDMGTQGRGREDRVNRRAQERRAAEAKARELAAQPPPPTAREERERERSLREAAERAKRERAEQEERVRAQRARLENGPPRYSAQRHRDELDQMLDEASDKTEEDELGWPIVLKRRPWQPGPDAPAPPPPPPVEPAPPPPPAEPAAPEVVVLSDSESEEVLDKGQLPAPWRQDVPANEWRKVNRRQPDANPPRRRTMPSSVAPKALGADLKAQRKRDAMADVKVKRVTNLVSQGEQRVRACTDSAENLESRRSEVAATFTQVLTGFLHVLADARSRDYFVYTVANNSILLTRWRMLALQLRVLAGGLMAGGYPFPGHLLDKLHLLLDNAVLAEPSSSVYWKRCDTPGRRNGMNDELKDLAEWLEANFTEVPAEFGDEAGRDADSDDDAGVDGDAPQ